MSFKINLSAPNATLDQITKINRAIAIAEKIVNGDNFKAWFLDTKFTQLETSDQTMGKNNTFLFNMLMDTATFKYYIVKRPWYKRFSSVEGWEDVNGVYTYLDVFNDMNDQDLAGHITHEATHDLGFSHSFNNVPLRPMSVPYAVGNYVADPANLS